MNDAGDKGKLADTAYQSLLAKILSHDMPGGTVIQERKLAESMSISRTPMRDALGRLEGEGLLVRLTDRLLSVRVITLDDYLHSLDVRAMMEPQAAALCVPRVTADLLAALQAELDRLAAYQGSELDDRHWQFDDLLHETVAERSGNPFLFKVIREMRRYTKIFERQTVPTRLRPGLEDHRRLLAALATGRPDKARDVMAEHIRNVRKRALDGL